VTQPTVSRSIAQLETSLGVKLFERGPRGLELTADGTELHSAVEDGVRRIGEAIRSIQARRTRSKPIITLSLSSSFVAHWLLPRLSEFNTAFPNVDLRFDLIPGVMRGVPDNVDLATRIVPDGDALYHRWPLAPEIIIPVCSPSYLAARAPLDHDGTGAGHVFLHLTDHSMYQWAREWGRIANRDVAEGVWHEFTDYAVILQAAFNGEGIALGWVSVVSSALLRGTLVPASDRRLHTGRWHSLIAPRSKPLAPTVVDIAQWLIDRITAELDRLAPLIGQAQDAKSRDRGPA
jgi:LysR family glycine cleavage system transcriptional activator